MAEVVWENGDFEGVELSGFSGDEFATIYGKNMQIWWPEDMPDGSTYFMLDRLQLVTDGNMSVHVTVLDENGAPVQGVPVVQGWVDGPVLAGDQAPNGSDPRDRPNRGNVAITNSYGVAEWTWGSGEGHDPAKTEGAHWYWVPMGADGVFTDVVYGFGWRFGTNHYHVEPVFRRVAFNGDGGDDLEGILADLFSDMADLLKTAAISIDSL